MSYIKVLGGNFIKLTGSYAHNTSTIYGLSAHPTIDAAAAPWIGAISTNRNPDAGASSVERD